jgi:hypothetical protein
MNEDLPDPELVRRVEALLGGHGGSTSWAWSRVSGGYTNAGRWRVRFADGGSVFVKAATGEDTADWLRAEHRMYAHLGPRPFLPALLGWDGGGEAAAFPILVLEDLGAAHWPPPWDDRRVRAVLDALAMVRAALPFAPPELPSLEAMRGDFACWRDVAGAPEPFLALGLCTPRWLDEALPTLIAAEDAARLDGDDLLHRDVRSDNLCFRPESGAALLVDWNWACRGNGRLDITGWLPSLHAEGGPLPETVLPDEPELATLLAGFWASRAGKPDPRPGSRVRQVQRQQLRVALPWAARRWACHRSALPDDLKG